MSDSMKTVEQQGGGETSPVEKKTPNKRGRLSFIERAQKESEELVKNMGGSLELEGGRRTRSSTRGTPSRAAVVTPPPVKKVRNSPASPKTTPRARGRGRKIDATETPEPPEQQQNKEKEEKLQVKTPTRADSNTPEGVSAEKLETNGPEESKEEPVNVVVPEKSENVEVEPSKGKKDDTVKKVSQAVDEIDSESKTVAKEKDSVNEVIEKEKPKESAHEKSVEPADAPVDSPMDVDEQSNTQESTVVQHEDSKSGTDEIPKTENKATTNTAESQSKPSEETISEPIEKDLSPEPMEVDSSSKSSDVIECTDVVDKVETVASSEQTEIKSSVEKTADKPVSNVIANDALPIVEKVAEVVTNSEKNGATGDISPVKKNDVANASSEAEVKSTDEPAATNESKTDNSVIESKTENNIDEPKVTPPKVSAAGDSVVTTV